MPVPHRPNVIRCQIAVTSEHGQVSVSVYIPRSSPEREIDFVLTAVARVFARVACRSDAAEDCRFEPSEPAHSEEAYGFVLKRKFTDADYPDRLRLAFQEMAESEEWGARAGEDQPTFH